MVLLSLRGELESGVENFEEDLAILFDAGGAETENLEQSLDRVGTGNDQVFEGPILADHI